MPKKTTKPPRKGHGRALSEILAAKSARTGNSPHMQALRGSSHQAPQQRGGRPKRFPGRTGGR